MCLDRNVGFRARSGHIQAAFEASISEPKLTASRGISIFRQTVVSGSCALMLVHHALVLRHNEPVYRQCEAALAILQVGGKVAFKINKHLTVTGCRKHE